MTYAEDQLMHSQADQFAAAILMPEQATIEAWNASESIDELSDIFNVPAKAVVLRLEQLGIRA